MTFSFWDHILIFSSNPLKKKKERNRLSFSESKNKLNLLVRELTNFPKDAWIYLQYFYIYFTATHIAMKF